MNNLPDACRPSPGAVSYTHLLDGLSGIVGAEISKHKNLSNNEEVNLNIHKGALDMFLAYQYDNKRSDIRSDVNQFNYEQDPFHEISASEYSDRSHSHDYNVGMNYAINKNHTKMCIRDRFYTVTFTYDSTAVKFDFGFAARVRIWKDTGEPLDVISVSYTHLDVYKRQE